MNLKTNQKGFTIVELLIVIVVIAILAAISIVAYVGIQNNARASERQSDATNIAKVAETIFATTSSYPTSAGDFQNAANASLPAGVTVGEPVAAAAAKTAAEAADYSGEKTYQWTSCSATEGGVVYYMDPRESGEAGVREVNFGKGC